MVSKGFSISLLCLVLFGLLLNAQDAPASESTSSPEPQAEAKEKEDDKKATYFTQEMMQEFANITKHMNKKLWGCNLLTSCKLKSEQVRKNHQSI